MAVLELVKRPAQELPPPTLGAHVEMALEVLRMALRNITRNGRRSLLSGAMVAVGVAAILFARAYLTGMNVMIEQGVIEAGYGALQVMHEGYATSQEMSPLHLDLPQDDALADKIRGAENVRAVSPRMQFMGMVSGADNSAAFRAIGIEPQSEALVCPRGPAKKTDRLFGAPLSANDAPEVILGTELARGLGAKLGDTVTLLVHTRTGSMDAVDVTLVGTYRFDDLEMNKRLAVVPLGLAQKLLHMPGRVTSYAVGITDVERLEDTVGNVRRALEPGPWPTETQDWGTLLPYYRDMIRVQDAVLGVLLFIVFGLVLIGVVNAMLMSVFERTREIGTLMSMGFSRPRIAGLFLCEAAALGIIASFIGGCAGTAITLYTNAHGIAFRVPGVGIVQNRPILAASFVALAVVGAISGALAGGLWPAWRASKLQPVQALSSH
jgi:putative ABC transport system permease protein